MSVLGSAVLLGLLFSQGPNWAPGVARSLALTRRVPNSRKRRIRGRKSTLFFSHACALSDRSRCPDAGPGRIRWPLTVDGAAGCRAPRAAAAPASRRRRAAGVTRPRRSATTSSGPHGGRACREGQEVAGHVPAVLRDAPGQVGLEPADRRRQVERRRRPDPPGARGRGEEGAGPHHLRQHRRRRRPGHRRSDQERVRPPEQPVQLRGRHHRPQPGDGDERAGARARPRARLPAHDGPLHADGAGASTSTRAARCRPRSPATTSARPSTRALVQRFVRLVRRPRDATPPRRPA